MEFRVGFFPKVDVYAIAKSENEEGRWLSMAIGGECKVDDPHYALDAKNFGTTPKEAAQKVLRLAKFEVKRIDVWPL